MKRWMALLMSVLALGLVAAGCGDDDDDDGDGGAATTEQTAPADTGAADTGTQAEAAEDLTVTADQAAISWEPTELSAPAGSVTLTLDNPAEIPHNITLEGVDNGATETVQNDTTSVTVDLEAGDYTYFCSVGNHRQQGMEGTLTVE